MNQANLTNCTATKMINVTLYCDGHPHHLAYLYAGAFELAQRGEIKLKLVYPWSIVGEKPCPGDATLWAEIEDPERRLMKRVVFDLHDKSSRFIEPRLERCDVYFKRSYYRQDIEQLAPHLGSKVQPLGLSFSCRSRSDESAILRAIGYYATHYFNIRRPLQSAKWLYFLAYLIKECQVSPRITDFEGSPDQALLPVVFFQTRVWSDQGTNRDSAEVNEKRVAVIRALKRSLGPQFMGGLVPDEFARKHFPDCLTSLPTNRKKFVKLSQQCLIGVYTRGLHHSVAWKMPEYLAAAKCIVSEPLRNELPVPLESGRNYLEFTSPQECVSACKRLLNDPLLSDSMRKANHAYYMTEIEPSTRLLRCLHFVLAG